MQFSVRIIDEQLKNDLTQNVTFFDYVYNVKVEAESKRNAREQALKRYPRPHFTVGRICKCK